MKSILQILEVHNLHFLKADIYQIKRNLVLPKLAKMTFLELLDPPKIDFTQNLGDRKFLKFPHCAQCGKLANF